MSKTFIARDTSLSDTFESNYPTTEGGTIEWLRQMTEASAAEVESTWTFPNSASEKIVYHVEIGKVNWSDDRIGSADWITRLRIGASGDANVEVREIHIRRVSADGNTIRASISTTGLTTGMSADTNIDDATHTADTSLDNPGGAAATDHLVVVYFCTNTHAHGGAETVDIEQNTAVGTRIIAPIDDPAPTGVAAKPNILNSTAMI